MAVLRRLCSQTGPHAKHYYWMGEHCFRCDGILAKAPAARCECGHSKFAHAVGGCIARVSRGGARTICQCSEEYGIIDTATEDVPASHFKQRYRVAQVPGYRGDYYHVTLADDVDRDIISGRWEQCIDTLQLMGW